MNLIFDYTIPYFYDKYLVGKISGFLFYFAILVTLPLILLAICAPPFTINERIYTFATTVGIVSVSLYLSFILHQFNVTRMHLRRIKDINAAITIGLIDCKNILDNDMVLLHILLKNGSTNKDMIDKEFSSRKQISNLQNDETIRFGKIGLFYRIEVRLKKEYLVFQHKNIVNILWRGDFKVVKSRTKKKSIIIDIQYNTYDYFSNFVSLQNMTKRSRIKILTNTPLEWEKSIGAFGNTY